MTLHTLDRQATEIAVLDKLSTVVTERGSSATKEDSLAARIDATSALPRDLSSITGEANLVVDFDELGRRILQSALSSEGGSFVVRCRSTRRATEFATPMRSLLLALNSGFGGISATVSPALLLHTYPAMDALVNELEGSGAGELWQPIGERSLAIGDAKHIFVSVDTPVIDSAHNSIPTVLVEVVGAHMISAEWFENVVTTRCKDSSTTFVFYGQHGFAGSIFEQMWRNAEVNGVI